MTSEIEVFLHVSTGTITAFLVRKFSENMYVITGMQCPPLHTQDSFLTHLFAT